MTRQEFLEKYVKNIGTLVTCGQVVHDFNMIDWRDDEETARRLEEYRRAANKKIQPEMITYTGERE